MTKYPLLNDKDWLNLHYVEERKTLAEVATLAGVFPINKTTVRRALLRHGIQPRSVSEGKTGRTHKGTPKSEETRRKIAASKTGKPSTAVWTEEMRESLAAQRRGELNPMYGRRAEPKPPIYKRRPSQPAGYPRLRLRRYGITPEVYAAMVEAQGGKCAICSKEETRQTYGRTNPLSVDHDHATGKIRKLLCHSCNVMVGHANDDPAILQLAIDYIKAH